MRSYVCDVDPETGVCEARGHEHCSDCGLAGPEYLLDFFGACPDCSAEPLGNPIPTTLDEIRDTGDWDLFGRIGAAQ